MRRVQRSNGVRDIRTDFEHAVNNGANAPQDGSTAEKLKEVLLTWRADTSNQAPQKLLYLLENSYDTANMSGTTLKGTDAKIIAALDTPAREHGFRLGLAEGRCYVMGPAEYKSGGDRMHPTWARCAYDEDSDEDSEAEDDVTFAEITSRKISFKHLVDFEGELISEKLQCDQKAEMIPSDMARVIASGEHERQEHEGIYGSLLHRWYRRTLLVVWPAERSCALYDPETCFQRAVYDLQDIDKECTSAHAAPLIDFLLTNRAQSVHEAVEAVCAHALAKDNVALWARAVATCADANGPGVSLLDDETWQFALEEWGWEPVRPSFEVMLANDRGNKTRLDFLQALVDEPWEPMNCEDEDVEAMHEEIEPWAEAQLEQVLRSLRPPTVDECEAIFGTMVDKMHVAGLADVVLQQVTSLTTADVLREFADQLSSDCFADFPGKSAMASALLNASVSKAAAQPKPAHALPTGVDAQPPAKKRRT